MLLTQFRTRYPHGSLISELITIDRGQYIVRVTLQVEGIILATGLAAADGVETAEDRARERALLALGVDNTANLPDSTVTAADRPERVIDRPVPQKTTTPKQLVTTANEANKVKSFPVNTPPIASTASPVETIDSGINNYLVESSHPPQKIDTTDFDTSSPDLSLSAVPAANPELVESKSVPPSLDAPSLGDGVLSTQEISPEPLEPPRPEVPSTQTLETVEFDFNEIKNRTDVEIKRLGWTKDQGRDFLLQTYGKRSRLHLTDRELMDFLYYLESQPN